LSGPGSGVHVVPERFFPYATADCWHSHINESIAAKVSKYSDRPEGLHKPCWLLVNLKPYLPGDPANRQFLATGVQVEEPAKVSAVFERVFALTEYIPVTGSCQVCPVRALLP
jgi:hypothetical protein